MDLDAVRTVVAVADTGRFQEAAHELAITQQAVSKRVAALERELGVRLFTRTARGATLTADGHAFLPHARDLLRAAERATASVRPGGRALRVDVINPRIAPAQVLGDFHRTHPGIGLDVVTLFDARAAVEAVRSGAVDASFRAVARPLPDGVTAVRVLDEPIEVLTGPDHALADTATITPEELAAHPIWMPAAVPGTEWGAFYDELATAFGLTLDVDGPNFGTDALLDVVAGSPTLATFVGERTRLVWPAGHDLRRVAVRDPTPVYPHSLVWRGDNPHPDLAALRGYLGSLPPGPEAGTWSPAWPTAGPGGPGSGRAARS